jgi:hypothetical protein
MSASVMCGFWRYGVSGPPGAWLRIPKRMMEISSSSGIFCSVLRTMYVSRGEPPGPP